jgi:5-methyltetrahydropteroyltriglutamate--homocysteine methyltransferase
VDAFVPGIYPRSEALVQATRDLDRARTTPEAVADQVAQDREALISVQQQAGIDLLADGMLTWQDTFRPLVEGSEGLEKGALTRFLDTNTFYRAPNATSDSPRLRAPLGAEYVAPLSGNRLVTLPSPFAFSLGTGLSAKTVAEGVLKPALDALGDVALVVLSEPFLSREEDVSLRDLEDALAVLAGGPRLALWLTFGSASRLLQEGIAELPVDGIGIDFYATPATDLPDGFDKLLLAGVLDARNSTLEDPREIASFAGSLRARGVKEIALVPNGDLQYVSEAIAREKLGRLGAARNASVEEAA